MGMVSHRRCQQNGWVKIRLHIPEASLILSSRIASTTLPPSKPRGTLPRWTHMPFSWTIEDRCSTGLRVKPSERSSSSSSDPSRRWNRSRTGLGRTMRPALSMLIVIGMYSRFWMSTKSRFFARKPRALQGKGRRRVPNPGRQRPTRHSEERLEGTSGSDGRA